MNLITPIPSSQTRKNIQNFLKSHPEYTFDYIEGAPIGTHWFQCWFRYKNSNRYLPFVIDADGEMLEDDA